MNLPKPASIDYDDLIKEVEKGYIKIPQFQRDFVWDLEKSANLLDSILKGYPIGTFILWKTQERLKTVGALGNVAFREAEPYEMINYVLDGQQRITSLFVALKALKVGKIDYSEIYVNLENYDNDDKIVFTDTEDMEDGTYIKFSNLLEHSIVDLYHNYDEEKLKRIEKYKNNVKHYNFSIIKVEDTPIEIATEIFTRINSGGKALSVFEIMCAKIFDIKLNFDLNQRFEKLTSELSSIDFDTIPSSLPLQLISLILTGNCKGKTILSLKKEYVINIWDNIIVSIKAAIDYVRSTFAVPSSKLLPYDVLLIPIAYYFYRNNNKSPVGKHNKHLMDMFWRYSLMQRYNNATDSKLATDIKTIESILNNNEYKPSIRIDLTENLFKENGAFRLSSSFTKAMICFYIKNIPKRLDNNESSVIVDDKQLLRGNGKNYHHFFPKAFMKKKNFDLSLVDNIVNIILVDDYTNKYKIKDKAPSIYIKELEKENHKIQIALASHYIGEPEEYGLISDDYITFYSKRVNWIIDEFDRMMCLDSNVELDEEYENNEETNDITSADIYTSLWNKVNDCIEQNNINLHINEISKSRMQIVQLNTSKVQLRFVASTKNEYLACELLVKDDLYYSKILNQKKDFEELSSQKELLWSDFEEKSKKIIMRYPKSVDFFNKKAHEKLAMWLIKEGILLKETVELFLEDIISNSGTAPDEVNEKIKVYCKGKNIEGVGFYLGKRIGFEIIPGSTVKISNKAYGAAQKKREELFENGTIKKLTETKGEFIKSYICNTPSQAADIILGGSNNGWIMWKDENNKNIDVLFRNKKN
ncbi:DUF4357 domain-containing protein [Clostridium beijerinckii]|uniref:DUF4357 domain-containing protein n=1 Tax=Clostridium beijerinckii TaxID=1520 RepID=A0A1S9NAU0_CLOBE|nr:DUF4357 domain-containing protein [Clostridium beijerinckii]OOP74667.1 hypothetical protein CBEIBR21_00430 [Clostridium beijerinckii]